MFLLIRVDSFDGFVARIRTSEAVRNVLKFRMEFGYCPVVFKAYSLQLNVRRQNFNDFFKLSQYLNFSIKISYNFTKSDRR